MGKYDYVTVSSSGGYFEGHVDRGIQITWSDKSETHHPGVPEKIECVECKTPVSDRPAIVRFAGYCGECYPQVSFGVPHEMDLKRWSSDSPFYWRRKLKHTFNPRAENRDRGPDWNGNHFGVGDTVLYDVRKDPDEQILVLGPQEGRVVEIHEYKQPCYAGREVAFLTRVEVDGKKADVLANRLEALTCEHVEMDTSRFEGIYDNMPCGFNPMEGDEPIPTIFKDDVARAIWMFYISNHLTSTGDVDRLNEGALATSAKLKKVNLPKDRVHIWFKREFEKTGLRMENPQIQALVPYLVGEKTTGYHVAEPVGV